ncbi:hypothetical protein R5R35_006977 [Gryllus longicercus]|uniref:SSD domain-containing protein n=1 Tax=Gryllus longicercus TaxID=2509291 RepID=A0AAN9VS83_9ORTH
MNWYARIVAHHPYVVLIAVAVFAGTCLVIPLTTKTLPNFTDPQLGFEARGTVLAQRLTSWENLIRSTGLHGQLTVNPKELKYENDISNSISSFNTKFKRINGTAVADRMTADDEDIDEDVFPHISPSTTRPNNIPEVLKVTTNWKYSDNTPGGERRVQADDSISVLEQQLGIDARFSVGDEHLWTHNHTHISHDGFFCNAPSMDYARVVFSGIENGDLFTWEAMLSMCRLQILLSQGPQYHHLCETSSHNTCCQPWSLPNYITLLQNRTSCLNITKEDLNATLLLLMECAPYFHNLKLTPGSQEAPSHCIRHDAVYNIMYYLVDTGFLPPNDSRNATIFSTMLILPLACSFQSLDYYTFLQDKKLEDGNVRVVAMEFGLKNKLFDESLIRDTWMIAAGGLFVLICMWMYTSSIFITAMTVIAIAFSLGISYFMYTLVFELRFFPFMNLLASIVAVGIGADDAFIFCKVWQCAKGEKNNGTLVKLVHDTLKHAVVSMLVSSVTTAAAFYAGYVSNITAIRCFSVFAGTATLANFLLMVTWLPASVVVSERWCCPPVVPLQWDSKLRPARAAAGQARAALDRLLVWAVLRLCYLWLVLLGGAAVAAVVVVFYHPRLKLPDSRDFQLFDNHHPFEQYDLVYKDKFMFEHLSQKNDLNMKLPLRFVWGIVPQDNGDYMDPSSRGTLQFDRTFDMADPESQTWLYQFCRNLRAQPFYQSTRGPLLPNCFIESFISWMHRRCKDPSGENNRAPCCETSLFPYRKKVFENCIVDSIASLYETPHEIALPGVAGPKFSRNLKKPRIKAVVVEYDSNHSYSMSFTEMNAFYQKVEKWMESQLATAPPGMRNGWFVSELDFYDLQLTLSEDTLLAIGVAMGIALVVLLLVTLNVLISLYAVLTITCIIFVTVAILVLLGWKLNVLESIAVSVAIGLAVDFSLHYGVHYRICPEGGDRETAVTYAVSRMGGPTAMAALTTAAAGAFMLPSSVLAYIQIGIFLVVVMLVSWVYSTFFLGSLLRVGGPQHGFGQFSYPSCDCGEGSASGSGVGTRGRERMVGDVAAYANVLSESTLSTSSTMCALHPSANESHELEALTSRSRHKSLRRTGSLSAALPSVVGTANRAAVTRKVSLPVEQSPSAASATTIVLTDDLETDCARHRDDFLLKH